MPRLLTRKPKGYCLIDEKIERDTHQCKHCQRHFAVVPGQEYGWCHRCGGVVCDKRECYYCIPIEARLDWQEGARMPFKYRDAIEEFIRMGGVVI